LNGFEELRKFAWQSWRAEHGFFRSHSENDTTNLASIYGTIRKKSLTWTSCPVLGLDISVVLCVHKWRRDRAPSPIRRLCI